MNNILTALTWRRAVKNFDSTKKVSDEDLKTILESARLAPSVYGIEAWKFVVVQNPELRTQLRAASYDQSKVTDASHLVVIAARTDAQNIPGELAERTAAQQHKTLEQVQGLKGAVEGLIASKPEGAVRDGWLAGQTFIPLAMMMETASLLNIDNAPFTGFDAVKVDEILGLQEKNLVVVSMLALGYRAEDAYSETPKVRRTFSEVVEMM